MTARLSTGLCETDLARLSRTLGPAANTSPQGQALGTRSVADAGPIRWLILACGNTLRGDDGVGPWLASWAEQRFRGRADIRIITRQQWTPELAQDISQSEDVLFIDSSADSVPGAVRLDPVSPAKCEAGIATHHLHAPQLLALSKDLYSILPRTSLLLTVGVDSTELSETFSEAVRAALPQACGMIEQTVTRD
jgi:hydrogenase maturation protease